MVWDTLNPKYSPNSAMSFFITVDLPDPLGPQRTSGLGGAGGGLDLRSIVTHENKDIFCSTGTQAVQSNFKGISGGF